MATPFMSFLARFLFHERWAAKSVSEMYYGLRWYLGTPVSLGWYGIVSFYIMASAMAASLRPSPPPPPESSNQVLFQQWFWKPHFHLMFLTADSAWSAVPPPPPRLPFPSTQSSTGKARTLKEGAGGFTLLPQTQH